MGKNPEFVKFDKVDKSYDGKVLVVKDLQLDIAEGEFITMLGPSGSGKSSILRASYKEKLPLFGPDDRASFRKSCKDKSFREYYNYKDVLRKRFFRRITSSR